MTSKKRNRYLWLFILGVSIVLGPQLVIFYNEVKQDSQMTHYLDSVAAIPEEQIEQFFAEAAIINNAETAVEPAIFADDAGELVDNIDSGSITATDVSLPVSDPFSEQSAASGEQPALIADLIAEEEVFAFLEIPKIGETLPLYLGATADHLAKGVAQVTGSSLPTGGTGTHAVIAGHRGFYGATFFRYIDQLEPGDRFYIHILNQLLAYEVTGQAIVEPEDTASLTVAAGEDLVTLLSCDPYPTDRYRILVYGKRVTEEGGQASYLAASTGITAAHDGSAVEAEIALEGAAQEAALSAEETTDSEDNAEPEESQKEVASAAEDASNAGAESPSETTTFTDQRTLQSSGLNSEIASVARNHKWLNRLVILAGILAIFYCIGLIYRNKRKQSQ